MVLFAAAVSAVLVPAFTRQWQDRQKEREIKVALVSEIGDSTSDALVTSQYVASQALPNGQERPMPPPVRGSSCNTSRMAQETQAHEGRGP
jgi:hypothetical protein